MPSFPAKSARRWFVDLSPLRHSRRFARLWWGTSISAIGTQMTAVVVGLHIYDLTDSTLAVAMVGTVSLVPMILSGLYGGALADRFDRRAVALWTTVLSWAATAGLLASALGEVRQLWCYYALTTVQAVAGTITATTRSAITPRLLPAELLAPAAALNGIRMGVTLTVGPALGGAIVAASGFWQAYLVDVVLSTAAFLGLLGLPAIHPDNQHKGRGGLRTILDGLAFVRRAPNIKASFLVDIVAMVFGHPRVVFPAVGALAIGGGAVTVGVLNASFAVGVFLSSLISGRFSGYRWQGRAVGWSIQGYGACIAAFGAVILTVQLLPGKAGEEWDQVNLPALIAAFVFLAGAGAADNVSAIFRSAILQSATPDALRGRMQGLMMVVVTGGPRVGDLYVGLLASWALLWVPQLAGGLVIIALTAVLMRSLRSFRAFDALDPRP